MIKVGKFPPKNPFLMILMEIVLNRKLQVLFYMDRHLSRVMTKPT
jgi:hypothetical protein